MKQDKFTWLKKINSPIIFQGHIKRKNYFEGWYYRQVSKDRKNVACFIPGISLTAEDPHSFVQYIYVYESTTGEKKVKTGYVKYPIESFRYSNNPFKVEIENNTFTEAKVEINLVHKDAIIRGTLNLGTYMTIKKSILMPNIMGYFAYIPNMECNHGVISMNHRVSGKLRINSEEIDFNNGRGYLEKDWGTSFPKEYIWIQCNNFCNESISLFCSIAHIPFLKRSFTGFICNLVVEDSEYRFATYNNSTAIIKKVSSNKVTISLENHKAKLEIQAMVKDSGELIAPKLGKMREKIKEESAGQVKMKLYDKMNNSSLEEQGYMAGIEIVGYDS